MERRITTLVCYLRILFTSCFYFSNLGGGAHYDNSYNAGQRQYHENSNRAGPNPNYRGKTKQWSFSIELILFDFEGNRGGNNYRGGNRGGNAGYNGNGYQKSNQYQQNNEQQQQHQVRSAPSNKQQQQQQ